MPRVECMAASGFVAVITCLLFGCASQKLSCVYVELPPKVRLDPSRCANTAYSAAFYRCTGIPGSDRLSAEIEAKARALAEYDLDEQGDNSDCERVSEFPRQQEAICEVPYRSGDLLSVTCDLLYETVRPESAVRAIYFDLRERPPRQIELASIFVDDELERRRFWQHVADDLHEAVAQSDEFSAKDRDWVEEKIAAASQEYEAITFNDRGAVVFFTRYFLGWTIGQATVPWPHLHKFVRKRFQP